jgi:hypothetical protein
MSNTAFVAYGGATTDGPFSVGGSPSAIQIFVSYGAIEPDGTPAGTNKVIIYPAATDDADSIRVQAAAAVRNDLSDPEVEIVFIDHPGAGTS